MNNEIHNEINFLNCDLVNEMRSGNSYYTCFVKIDGEARLNIIKKTSTNEIEDDQQEKYDKVKDLIERGANPFIENNIVIVIAAFLNYEMIVDYIIRICNGNPINSDYSLLKIHRINGGVDIMKTIHARCHRYKCFKAKPACITNNNSDNDSDNNDSDNNDSDNDSE